MEEKSQAQIADEAKAQKAVADPYEFLAKFPGAPTKAQVEAWKSQAPNGIIRIFAPSDKRVYLARGISGLELDAVQNQIPINLGADLNPEARQAKIEKEISLLVSSKCIVWTSDTTDGKLTPDILRGGSAGLPASLFALITWLSDFIDPEAFQVMSAEL